MRILIDKDSIVERIDQQVVNREMRYEVRYYYAPRDPRSLFVLVSRCGVLELLLGRVCDAAVGWTVGWHGKCHPAHDGLQLMKVTLFNELDGEEYDATLSSLVEDSRRLKRRKPPRGAPWARPYGFDPEDTER